MTEFTTAGAITDLEDGKPKACQVSGRSLVLVKSGERVFALDGTCPHRGGPLAEGFVAEDCLVCPWHGWGFRLATGAYVGSPGVGVKTYPTEVKDGAVGVALA
jgi:nitrite reductase/ring-hydroxylating ferredoxin subunit